MTNLNNITNINNINNPLIDQEENILKQNQLLSEDNKDENCMTDSDIDDPKYMPMNNILENNNQINIDNNNLNNFNIINNFDNFDNQNKREWL